MPPVDIILVKDAAGEVREVRTLPETQTISGAVAVTNWPNTQPVSLATNAPDVTDRAARLLGHVTVDNASIAVTGAFWQSVQPVSQSGAWTVAISGTIPVSGPLTDAQLRASAVAVSGTFWQATQPVSIAATVAVSGPLTDAQLRASAVPVSLAALPKAREDTAAMTWASLKSAAPAANAVQATTGALTAGDYDFDIYLCASDTAAVGKGLVIEHRNAADGATLQTLGGIPAGVSDRVTLRRYTIAANERIRVIAGTAAGAASSMYVSAIGRRIS